MVNSAHSTTSLCLLVDSIIPGTSGWSICKKVHQVSEREKGGADPESMFAAPPKERVVPFRSLFYHSQRSARRTVNLFTFAQVFVLFQSMVLDFFS